MSQTAKDLVGVLRGLQLIVEAGINLQRETFRTVWTSSSFKTARSNCTEKVSDLKKVSVTSTVSETVSRLNTVLAGIQELLKYKRPEGRLLLTSLTKLTHKLCVWNKCMLQLTIFIIYFTFELPFI